MVLSRKYTRVITIVILAVILFGGGFMVGKKSANNVQIANRMFFNKELGKPEPVDFSLFWQVLASIEDKYVDSSNIDYTGMLYGAISGMVDSLGDDYTLFMKPEKTETFMKSVSGNDSFEGVGMEIGIKNKTLTVISPIEGTPAYGAGIKAGDLILEIDGETTDGLTSEEAVSLIRGKKGTQVILTISRKSFDEPKEIIITRDTIKVPVMKWELINNDIAYVKIYQFAANLPAKFEDAVSEILNSNAKKLIIDVRNNPGGYLDSAAEISSWFLPKGSVVVKEEFRDGTGDEYKSSGYKAIQDFPVIMIVNKGSASASEIMAGALRDIKGTKLVGEKTFGKGSVQQVDTFKDDSSLKVTIAKWLTPAGISINKEGLVPDYEIELTEEDYNNNKDPQLDKAIQLLNE
jgi:carboxyl-terminal processing protease